MNANGEQSMGLLVVGDRLPWHPASRGSLAIRAKGLRLVAVTDRRRRRRAEADRRRDSGSSRFPIFEVRLGVRRDRRRGHLHAARRPCRRHPPARSRPASTSSAEKPLTIRADDARGPSPSLADESRLRSSRPA